MVDRSAIVQKVVLCMRREGVLCRGRERNFVYQVLALRTAMTVALPSVLIVVEPQVPVLWPLTLFTLVAARIQIREL